MQLESKSLISTVCFFLEISSPPAFLPWFYTHFIW